MRENSLARPSISAREREREREETERETVPKREGERDLRGQWG